MTISDPLTIPDTETDEHAALRQQVARLNALHRVHAAAASTLDLDPMLARVVYTVAEVMGSDACSVYLYDEERGILVLAAAAGLPAEAVGRATLAVGEGITGLAAQRREIVATTDAPTHPAFVAVPLLDETGLHTHIAVPIVMMALGRLVGVLNLHFRDERDIPDDDRTLLGTVAGELAIAIDHARMYHATDAALRRKVSELQTLQRVTATVTSTLDLTRVLETIAAQAALLGRADVVSMYEFSTDGDGLKLLAGYEAVPGEGERVRDGLPRDAVRRAMHASRSDVHAKRLAVDGTASDSGTVFCLPLRTAHGTIGGICLHFREGAGPTEEEIGLLQSFTNTAAIAIEQARLYDDVRRSLTRTSALLQEMHHRVRNNLQTVAALLSMHVRRAGNEEWTAPLREAINRIRSIAAVHDLLTREDIGITTVNEVAKLVTDEAATTLVPSGAEYNFRVQGPPASVTSREATVLAILINELVANAVLHGLEGRMHGTVRVSIKTVDGEVQVRVEDDGQGFPDGFRADRDGGLGLQIAQNLVTSDLRGSVALERSPLGGGAVLITFTPRLDTPEALDPR